MAEAGQEQGGGAGGAAGTGTLATGQGGEGGGAGGQGQATDGQQGSQGQGSPQGRQGSGQGEGTQQGSQQNNTPAAPESYDLKLPDQSLLGEDALKAIADTAKGLKLTNEQAQQLVQHRSDAVAQYAAQQQQAYQTERSGWIDQVKADNEIGGTKFDASVADARKAIEQFGSPAFKEALNQTGFGDHPEVVRVFAKIGAAMGEDKFVHGGASGGEGPSAAQRMFPSAADGVKPTQDT